MSKRMNGGEGEGGERISLFDRSQNEIMKLIFAVNYRVPDEGHASFDVHAIFSTSQKIIKDSANIIHNINEQGSGFNDVETPKASSSLCTLIKEKFLNVTGTRFGTSSIIIRVVGNWIKKNFNNLFYDTRCTDPYSRHFKKSLLIINSFGCKMSCKSSGDETSFESRTEEILTKLSSYPCEVQVVLALAVFALEYEECSSQLSKKSTTLKRQDAVVELNNLVNQALQVIEHILELEKLVSYDRDSEPKLARVIMDTPFNAYWSIITLVACATELFFLTGDEDIKSYDLSHFSHKMSFILNKLEGQLTICQQENEEAKAKAEEEFWKQIRTAPYEITEVFQRLVLFKHKAYPQPPIISVNPTNKEVFNINVLEWKWVLFYISSLDNVSDQEISCLKEVYEGIEERNECVILWIPVVEDWTEGGEEQFKEWRSKMPWYAVQYFSPPASGYLEQRWNFKGNPMVVVMNWEGEVAISNIIDLIRTQATKAIALLNVKMQKEIPRVEAAQSSFGTNAEAVEVLKSLTCPRQFTNTDATPVLLDGSNKQVNIDNELKWKDLFLLLSDIGIDYCYISYLKPVYEGIRRYPSYRIVWVPVVEQWNQDKG
ncbi:hypothetical protein ACFX14_044492 [Malus domestica]